MLKSICEYTRRAWRLVKWEMTPEQRMKFLKMYDRIDEILDDVNFKKARPKIELVKGDRVYKYPSKPDIYFNPYENVFWVTSGDWKRYDKPDINNQARFFVNLLHKAGLMNVKHEKYVRRPKTSRKEWGRWVIRLREEMERRMEPIIIWEKE